MNLLEISKPLWPREVCVGVDMAILIFAILQSSYKMDETENYNVLNLVEKVSVLKKIHVKNVSNIWKDTVYKYQISSFQP